MNTKLIRLINICLQKNIPFVSYRLPGEKDINTQLLLSGKFNFYESINEVIDKTGFVYAPFHRKTNFPVVFFENELVLKNDDFKESLIEKIFNKPPLYPEYSFEAPYEISKDDYLKQASKFIDSFDKGFRKAILSRVYIEKKPEHFDTGSFFIELQKSYPNAFCHLINIPGAGTWTGATPETLLRINEDYAQTVSLAATQTYTGKDQIIKWSEKELEEQQIVTDYIESVFKKFEIKNYKKEKTQNLIAGNSIHLETKFSFDKFFIENKLGAFLTGLHPTPAVCGFPKEKALDLIFDIEKHNREYYSGFMGTVNVENATNLFVNLRCMKILPDKLALFTGGGITGDSIPEKEWEETVLKAETLLLVSLNKNSI